MPELWILCMALDPLKLYPHMKFHFNSSVELELLHLDRKTVMGRKKCDVTYVRTDRQTDGRTDGRTDGQTDGRTDRQTDRKCDYYRAPAFSMQCPN